MRAALFLRRAKGSFFSIKRDAPIKNGASDAPRIFNVPSGLQKPCRSERKNLLRRRKKTGGAGKIPTLPLGGQARGADLPPDVAEEFGNGKWREIIGNYGKIKMVWGGFGFRICVRKLFAPTP